MFRGFFNKHDGKDEFFEPADPVVERRRQEKFSAPLLYDEEFNHNKPEDTNKGVKVVKENKVVEATKTSYQMLDIISPIHGASNSKPKVMSGENQKSTPYKKRTSTNLVPVISPFHGISDSKVEYEDKFVEIENNIGDVTIEIPSLKEEEFETHTNPSSLEFTGSSVEENLRNLAMMSQEDQNRLKIIEERTGKFRLNLSDQSSSQSKSLIDEIEDDMSLDDLMSLYEKKFTD